MSGQRHAPAALYPGKDPVPIVQKAGWAPGPVWTGAENLAPTGFRSPGRPARSQSLYRLSYPAHHSLDVIIEFHVVASVQSFCFSVPSYTLKAKARLGRNTQIKQWGISYDFLLDLTRSSWVLKSGFWIISSGHKKYTIAVFRTEYIHKRLLNDFRISFRHRASCILGQAFHYSPENAFYILINKYISLSDICLTVHH